MPRKRQGYMNNSPQQTIIQLLIDKWRGWRSPSRKELYSLLSEARRAADDGDTSIRMEMLEDLLLLSNRIDELEKRSELLSTANVLAASRNKDDEVNQIPMKVSRTVDWRTKRLELEKKYSKGDIRDNLVKEISSPAELFKDE